MVKISVITVVLNGVTTIEQTIRSVLTQDYANLEYIIIDGGSTDGTLDIVKKYDSSLSFWVSEKDRGIYSAMNKGLQHATGEYVAFLNSDDWYEYGVVREIANFIDLTSADVVYGDYNRVAPDGQKTLIPALPLDYINISIPFCHQSVFMRRQNGLYFDERYKIASDYKMLLELYGSGKDFRYYPYSIANFRSGGAADLNDYYTDLEIYDIAAGELAKSVCSSLIYGEMVLERASRSKLFLDLQEGRNYWLLKKYLDDSIPSNEDIIVFGVGDLYRKFSGFIQDQIDRVKYFVDNDQKKRGKNICGKVIKSPQALMIEKDCSVLILNERYTDDIQRQLEEMNLGDRIRIINYISMKNCFWKNERETVLSMLFERYDNIRKLWNRMNSF